MIKSGLDFLLRGDYLSLAPGQLVTRFDTYIQWLILIWYGITLVVSLTGLAVTFLRYRRGRATQHIPPSSTNELPGVTIFRPICGLDFQLRENLISSLEQQYPKFEVIFSFNKADDPAIPLVRELIDEYPHVDARLIIEERSVAVNPKINNLVEPYRVAKHEVMWIWDSNVRLPPGCLHRSVQKLLSPQYGLVHHLPLGADALSLGADMEAAFLNTTHARVYLGLNQLSIGSCVIGKSNLYLRKTLQQIGGLEKFLDIIAEDTAIATAIWNVGYWHAMTCDVARHPLGSMSVWEHFARRARWARIRRTTVTFATLIEPFSESILLGLLVGWSVHSLFNLSGKWFFVAHMLAWFLMDMTIARNIAGNEIVWPRLILGWVLRELSALPLFIYAMVGSRFGSRLKWRGREYRIRYGGKGQVVTQANGWRNNHHQKKAL
ncbi:uncharacterized protein VTP21DRAFT_3123 [Calcarisporiella thermophila]|uniref:uncharacterized protein n=1 Tax=Calcarisporiella thermophila TaxID=911321 RepID=UPI0037429006